MESVKYKKGELIFAQGADENWMFSIVDGKVKIFADYDKTTEKELVTLEGGAFFGEMGMIEHLPRSATAVASENTTLIKITDDNFNEFCKENPSKVVAIMQATSRRLRGLTSDYLEACRTIKEFADADKNGEQKSKELMNKMKVLAGLRK